MPERADRGDGEQVGAARALQRIDIGAGVELGGRDRVAAAVAGQEDEAHPLDPPDQQVVRRRAPGSVDREPLRLLQRVDRVEAGAAHYADHPLAQLARP